MFCSIASCLVRGGLAALVCTPLVESRRDVNDDGRGLARVVVERERTLGSAQLCGVVP